MSNIEVGGPNGPGSISSEGGLGDGEFSPASLAVSQTIDQALKMIFAGEKSSSLTSPMELAATASKPAASSVGDPTAQVGKGFQELMLNSIENIKIIKDQPYLFPKGGDQWGTTESLEATMRFALSLGSKNPKAKKIFQACANTFAYLVREGKAQSSNGLPLEGYGQPQGSGFPQIKNQSSATDADIQLVSNLIKGRKIFGPSITMYDGNSSQSIDDYIKGGINGLENSDIINGQWIKGSPGNNETIDDSHSYDYVNYNSVRIITNYAFWHGIRTKNIKHATNADLTYQIDLLSKDSKGESYFNQSGEQVLTEQRTIMHLGEYLLNAHPRHPMYSKVKTLFTQLIDKGFANDDPWWTHRKIFSFYKAKDGNLRADIRGDSKDRWHWVGSDGAMLVALKALQKIGVKTIPGQQDDVETLTKRLSETFNNDMKASDKDKPPLVNTYFNAMVGLSAFADINLIDK